MSLVLLQLNRTGCYSGWQLFRASSKTHRCHIECLSQINCDHSVVIMIHTILAVLFPAQLVRKACTIIYTSYPTSATKARLPRTGEHDDDL